MARLNPHPASPCEPSRDSSARTVSSKRKRGRPRKVTCVPQDTSQEPPQRKRATAQGSALASSTQPAALQDPSLQHSRTPSRKSSVGFSQASDHNPDGEPDVGRLTSGRSDEGSVNRSDDIIQDLQDVTRQTDVDTLSSPSQWHDSMSQVSQGSISVHTKHGEHEDLDTVDRPASNADSTNISVEIGRQGGPAKADTSTQLQEQSFGHDNSESFFQGAASVLQSQSPLLLPQPTINHESYQLPVPRLMDFTLETLTKTPRTSRVHPSNVVSTLDPLEDEGCGDLSNLEERAGSHPGLAANGHMVEPGDDLTNALASLKTGQQLSPAIIQELLLICAPSESHVSIPIPVDLQFESLQGPRPWSLGDDVSQIILPLYDRKYKHWTLVIVRRADYSTYHFDSCRSLGIVIDDDAVHRYMKELDPQYKSKDIISAQCPQQSNKYDCGIEVIANSLYQMAGIEIPGNHNCGAWRSLCQALLSSNVAEVTRQTVMPEYVLKNVDDIASLLRNDALGRDDERRHQMARSTVEKLRCERAHVMSLTKEVVQIGAVLTSLGQSCGRILTGTNNDLVDVSVSREALCKDIKAADQQYSSLLQKFSLHDHRPALCKTLEGVKALESELQRRIQSQQTSRARLGAAQTTLRRVHEVCTRVQMQIDEDHVRLEGAIRAWHNEAMARAERAQGTLAVLNKVV